MHFNNQQRINYQNILICPFKYTIVFIPIERRAQWCRAPDSRLREPGFESCAAVLKPSFFTLQRSLSCINEYLAIYSGGCVRAAFRALIVAYGWMLPRKVEMVFD